MKYHLVIQTAFIGDLFLSIPTLQRIKSLYPEDKIILICKKGLKDFFLQTGLVDTAFEVVKNESESYRKVVEDCRSYQIENIFCLHRSFRSGYLSHQLRAKNKYGFKTWFSFLFFDKAIGYVKKWPDVVRQISLLSLVDSQLKEIISEKDWNFLNHPHNGTCFHQIPEVFKFKSLLPEVEIKPKKVALFPGSVWATKKWSSQGYAYVATQLLNLGYEVFVLGGPDDVKDSEEIKQREPRVQNLTGQMKLLDSTLFLQDAALVLCNDSAPAHMAASLQRPVLSIFGPTVLDFGFRPWNDHSQVVESKNLSCRPCGAHGHKQCPLEHHQCMKDITGETVFKYALNMLSEK